MLLMFIIVILEIIEQNLNFITSAKRATGYLTYFSGKMILTDMI